MIVSSPMYFRMPSGCGWRGLDREEGSTFGVVSINKVISSSGLESARNQSSPAAKMKMTISKNVFSFWPNSITSYVKFYVDVCIFPCKN